jgi:hypothetical protein
MSYTAPTTSLAPFFGALVYFAKEGESIESTTVASDAKPPGSDFSDWEQLGCIETASIGHEFEEGETRRCFNATTGKWEKKQTKGQVASIFYEMTIQEVSEFLHQVAHHVAAIDSDGGGVPNSQEGGIYRGWVTVQQQNGTEITTLVAAWVELTMPNAMQIAGRTGSTPQLRLDVIDNTLNVIQFGTDTA